MRRASACIDANGGGRRTIMIWFKRHRSLLKGERSVGRQRLRLTATMPVSFAGYVNRPKVLPLPLDDKPYGPRNRVRNQFTVFILRG